VRECGEVLWRGSKSHGGREVVENDKNRRLRNAKQEKSRARAERYASNKRSGAYDLETSFRRIQDYQETATPEVLAGQVLGTWGGWQGPYQGL
jgi:hypothetical protein